MPYSATVQLLGHVGREVETKFTTAGKPMHKFSVYTADGTKDAKKFSWFDVVIFGDMPEFKLNAIVKGATVYVTGRLEIREYESKDGSKGKSAQVTSDAFNGVNVVAPPRDRTDGVVSRPRGSQLTAAAAPTGDAFDNSITDDDVPF